MSTLANRKAHSVEAEVGRPNEEHTVLSADEAMKVADPTTVKSVINGGMKGSTHLWVHFPRHIEKLITKKVAESLGSLPRGVRLVKKQCGIVKRNCLVGKADVVASILGT